MFNNVSFVLGCGSLLLGSINFIMSYINKERMIENSPEYRKIAEMEGFIHSTTLVFLKSAISLFFKRFAIIILIILVLEKNNMIKIDPSKYFLFGCISGPLVMCAISFICAYICSIGSVTAVVHASTKVNTAFYAGASNARIFTFFIVAFMFFINFFVVYLKNFYAKQLINGLACGSLFFGAFIRFCGGLFTKGADIGSDLGGKIFAHLDEDSPINPGVIADNAGDRVGDCIGTVNTLMCMYIVTIKLALKYIMLSPRMINVFINLPILVSMIAMYIYPALKCVDNDENAYKTNAVAVEKALMCPLMAATIFLLVTAGLAYMGILKNIYFGICGISLIEVASRFVGSAILFGMTLFWTDRFTAINSRPVIETANATIAMGGAINILYAYAYSLIAVVALFACVAIVPINIENALIFAGMIPVITALDLCGPIFDNAGGISSILGMVNARINAEPLDSAGNTTKSLTKGYINGFGILCMIIIFKQYKVLRLGTMYQMIQLIIGISMPLFCVAKSIFAVSQVAMITLESVQVKIKKFFDEKMSIDQLETSYYTDLAGKISRASFILSPMAYLLFIMSIFIKSRELGFGLIMISNIFAIHLCQKGALLDNAKKLVSEQCKVEIKAMRAKLDMYKKDNPNFDIEALRKNNDINDPSLLDAVNISSEIAKLLSAKDAAVTGDVVGDPEKDVSGPMMIFLVFTGICVSC